MREKGKKKRMLVVPMISHKHFRVATISDAAIPKDAIVSELDLITIVLLRVLAIFALQTCCR